MTCVPGLRTALVGGVLAAMIAMPVAPAQAVPTLPALAAPVELAGPATASPAQSGMAEGGPAGAGVVPQAIEKREQLAVGRRSRGTTRIVVIGAGTLIGLAIVGLINARRRRQDEEDGSR